MTAAPPHVRPEARLLLDGRPVDGVAVDAVPDPARPSAQVGVVHRASVEQATGACDTAEVAARSWAAVAADDRAARLAAAAASLHEHRRELAELLSAEHGKPLAEAAAEIAGAIGIVDWHAGQAACLQTERIDDPRGPQVRRRVPVGVVAVIVPWNYPVLLAQLMLAPALLAGNAVVVKLPDHAPLALNRALHLMAEHLPAGVVSVIAGPGDTVGATLTTHPAVRKVAFTGSTPTGRRIMAAASSTLKGLSLELGGNDPAIILPSATIDAALAHELVVGALTNAGQVCYAPKRLYVHRDQIDALTAAVEEAARDLVLGLPSDPVTTVGPLNNPDQLRTVSELADSARAAGATLTPLGRVADGLPEDGWWFQPQLVTAIDHESDLVQQEQFGPLVPVVAYDTVDAAVDMANDSEYGLAASVWSDDADEAFAVAERIQAGTVFVNVHRVGASAVDMPFGGFKQSGVGRGHGIEGIHEYTELQLIAERQDMRGPAPR